MIRFPCGTCGRRLRVPARLAGKRGRCERCGAINRVPLADALPPEEEHAHETPAEPGHPEAATAAAESPPSPPPAHEEEVRETPPPPPQQQPPPPPKPEPARSFSTEAVPVEQSVAVEAPRPAFGIDEASVFPPVGEFAKAPEADFSHAPAAPPEAAAREQPVDADAESEARSKPEAESDGERPREGGDEPAPQPAPEPEVVPVDVRRAPASPFRSTADMRPRQMIEGTVELSGAQFAATTLPATVGPAGGAGSGGAASTFLELVAQRVGVIHQPAAGTRAAAIPQKFTHPGRAVDPEDEEPVIRILHIDVDEDEPPRAAARGARVRVPETRPPAPVARAALPPAPAIASAGESARRAVVLALMVGLIIGFVLGLVVADLL